MQTYNQQTLRSVIEERLNGARFVVVSNREPFVHRRRANEIECIQPASGLTTALDPILRATNGLWVAHGSGNADREVTDSRGRIAVPPEDARYTLKRVWLSAAEEERYYYGFANQALWPLCHVAYQRPVFEEADWRAYQRVNRRFADAVADEIGSQRAFVFIQDYHLALVSGTLKQRCPHAITAQFWHIPWPNPEVFRICPWKQEILEGLLDNELLGFHLRYHCLNFLDAVARFLEARIDTERLMVAYLGADTKVRAFPISVDYEAVEQAARSAAVEAEGERLRERYGLKTEFLLAGADRLDYTKGIPERFLAIQRFLEQCPEYRGRFLFFQAGVPTRKRIGRYEQAEAEMVALAEQINRRFQDGGWRPIVFAREHFSPTALYALYRMADACVVSSLHDGMNLVAKEFVSARTDEAGVLILSQFTGAARELQDALLINPYATDDFAQTIRQALELPREEAAARMRRLRRTVARYNIYRWATEIIEKLSDLSEEETDVETSVESLAAGGAGD